MIKIAPDELAKIDRVGFHKDFIEFYKQFALAVAEICNDPELGLTGTIQKIKIKINEYTYPEFTIVSNSGQELKFLLDATAMEHMAGKQFQTRWEQSPGKYAECGDLYRDLSGIAHLTKDKIKEIARVITSGSGVDSRPLKQALADRIKAGLNIG